MTTESEKHDQSKRTQHNPVVVISLAAVVAVAGVPLAYASLRLLSEGYYAGNAKWIVAGATIAVLSVWAYQRLGRVILLAVRGGGDSE